MGVIEASGDAWESAIACCDKCLCLLAPLAGVGLGEKVVSWPGYATPTLPHPTASEAAARGTSAAEAIERTARLLGGGEGAGGGALQALPGC